MMTWTDVARRLVQGIDVQAGELIQVRDLAGRYEILTEVLLAIEEAGAVPLPFVMPARYLERLWTTAPVSYLAKWDQHRAGILGNVNRVITLAGDKPDYANADRASVEAWSNSDERMAAIEEERQIPVLTAALPTHKRAYQLGVTLEQLDDYVRPALALPSSRIQNEIDNALAALKTASTLKLRTGRDCELTMTISGRNWLCDDGYIDRQDRSAALPVSNLPAGSAIVAMVEHQTSGRLHLPILRGVKDVTLEITAGRISKIGVSNMSDLAKLSSWFDSHEGESRRLGYLSLGLNPLLTSAIGWSQIDQHVHGRVCIGFGDNTNYGGDNVTTLSATAVLANTAQLSADEKPLEFTLAPA
jgi:leucyl aminopeptidase (aminopeptidase T)